MMFCAADRNQPRSRASPIPQVIERRQLPKYERGPLGDEETIQLTSEREKPMTLDERLQYVDSLWPSLAPTDEDEEIMQYYGIEVQIISEEERALELEKVRRSAGIEETKEQPKAPEPEKPAAPSTPIGSTTSAQDTMSSPEIPELTVETRSATLQKQKEAEGGEKLVKTTKQDDWVQCDKCQKWRRLPSTYTSYLFGCCSLSLLVMDAFRRSRQCFRAPSYMVLQDEPMGQALQCKQHGHEM